MSGETGRLRDGVIPAAVGRADALLERLAEELEEVASLTERSLRGEPLPLSGALKILKRELRAPYWGDRDRAVN